MGPKSLLPVILLLPLSIGVTPAQSNRSETQLIKRGNDLVAKKEYEAALREYGRVPVTAGKVYAQSLYNMGVCYYELWRTEEAVVFYRLAVETRAGHYPRASYALGVALEDLGRVAEAKEAYRQSITASHAAYAPAYFKLGVVLAREGDIKTAADFFKKAIVRSRDQLPASHNNLGVMLARMGRLSEAEREFQIALRQMYGTDDDAAHNLKLCRSLLAAPTKAQLARLQVSAANDTPAGLPSRED